MVRNIYPPGPYVKLTDQTIHIIIPSSWQAESQIGQVILHFIEYFYIKRPLPIGGSVLKSGDSPFAPGHKILNVVFSSPFSSNFPSALQGYSAYWNSFILVAVSFFKLDSLGGDCMLVQTAAILNIIDINKL